jgi:predicted acetyltransferase
MDIKLIRVPIEEKSFLRNLLELYRYELSGFDGRDVDIHGIYGYAYLDHYWTEPDRHPFLVRVNGKIAGFVLVRATVDQEGESISNIAEFFILKKYRRQGIGTKVAHQTFDSFAGRWEVSQMANNLPAQAFWRSAIGQYTSDAFTEVTRDEPLRVVQLFRSRIG